MVYKKLKKKCLINYLIFMVSHTNNINLNYMLMDKNTMDIIMEKYNKFLDLFVKLKIIDSIEKEKRIKIILNIISYMIENIKPKCYQTINGNKFLDLTIAQNLENYQKLIPLFTKLKKPEPLEYEFQGLKYGHIKN